MAGDGIGRRLFRRRDGRADAAAAISPGAPELLAPLLDALTEPVLILDDMTVTHANAAARALLGNYVVDEDARVALRHPAAAAVLAGHEDGPVTLTGMGGRDRHWLLTAAPLTGRCRLLRLTDHSTQRAAERMRVDFVANASHELRTPLATLIGFIETLEEANGPADAATRRRFLAIMAGEARRMQRLIEDLMSLSRIEADRYMAPRERVDFTTIVKSAVADLGTGPNGDRILLDVSDRPLLILGDHGQLSQIVHNLVGNALKYGRSDAPVHVSVTETAEHLTLAVRDEGEGIAPEHLPRLTERFYRVDPGRSRAVGGTGLGLAIVKHIVERHRGRLEIASVVGQGTIVSVHLARARDALS